MAAETVAAYPLLSFHQDSINGFNVESHCVKDISEDETDHTEIHRTNSTDMKVGGTKEDDTAKEDESLPSEYSEIYNYSKSNEKMNGHDFQRQPETRKKRNARKRNRCDMSPDELRKLRERERKAQQNRRDRIRAQKRQAQGWHDDDAAWEAFLDQTDNSNDSSIAKRSTKKSSAIPSMVCNMSPHKAAPITDEFIDKPVEGTERIPRALSPDEYIQSQNFTKPNDVVDCYSDGGDEHLPHNSDDATEPDRLQKKVAIQRQFLPSEELERLRKRERDSKRKQRERFRSVNGNSPVSEIDDIGDERNTSPQSSEESKESPSETSIHDVTNDSMKHKLDDDLRDATNVALHKSPSVNDGRLSPRQRLSPPPFPYRLSPHYPSHHHHHHQPSHHRMHYPVVLMPETHYSPTSHYLRERHYSDMYFPRHLPEHSVKEERIVEHHYPFVEHHKRHLLSPHSFSPLHKPFNAVHETSISPPHKPNNELDASPPEKKKMISRNVDRKKLTEDELEELRRRERDYQRERRARIRMEKAKSQATHDQYQHRVRDDGLSHHYYQQSPIFHHSHEKLPHHVIGRYESIDRLDYHRRSPQALSVNVEEESRRDADSSDRRMKEECKQSLYIRSDVDTELLQVVPKTRDCEDLKTKDISPVSETSKSPCECKKSVLESICSTLKKDSPEWTENLDGDDDDEEKLVIVQPSTEIELSMANKMIHEDNKISQQRSIKPDSKDRVTVDQLERRRRSNREAQRRRRARLKMLGNSEDRTDNFNNSNDSTDTECGKEKVKTMNGNFEVDKENTQRACRGKVASSRPDSLYADDLRPHFIHRDTDDHHRFRDKYQYNHKDHSGHDGKYFYGHPYHLSAGMDDVHGTHMYHERHSHSMEKYRHDYPEFQRHYHRHIHSPHMLRYQTSEFQYDHPHHEHSNVANRFEESQSPSPVKPNYEPESEATKIGRKRKQCVPRKLVASASNSPDEDVDVCNVTESPETNNFISNRD